MVELCHRFIWISFGKETQLRTIYKTSEFNIGSLTWDLSEILAIMGALSAESLNKLNKLESVTLVMLL